MSEILRRREPIVVATSHPVRCSRQALRALGRIGLAVVVAFSVSSCDAVPPIARDLPSTLADLQPAFDQRVKERFPVGASEQEIVAELRDEGFTPLDPKKWKLGTFASVAAYEARRFPCVFDWTIYWSAENGKIAAIKGGFFSGCL
jgi:hypothetical protein